MRDVRLSLKLALLMGIVLSLIACAKTPKIDNEKLKEALHTACVVRSIEMYAYKVKYVGPLFFEGNTARTTFDLDDFDGNPRIKNCQATLKIGDDSQWYVTEVVIPGIGTSKEPVFIAP